jgi:hypothetical protein
MQFRKSQTNCKTNLRILEEKRNVQVNSFVDYCDLSVYSTEKEYTAYSHMISYPVCEIVIYHHPIF